MEEERDGAAKPRQFNREETQQTVEKAQQITKGAQCTWTKPSRYLRFDRSGFKAKDCGFASITDSCNEVTLPSICGGKSLKVRQQIKSIVRRIDDEDFAQNFWHGNSHSRGWQRG